MRSEPMRRAVLVVVFPALWSCGRTGSTVESSTRDEVLALADSIFAAAGERDAIRFAGHFSSREDFVYAINTRLLGSRQEVTDAFTAMLGRQAEFRPQWRERRVQLLDGGGAVFTGLFQTTAREVSGETWGAAGLVTFVAERTPAGWKVVNWHTSE